MICTYTAWVIFAIALHALVALMDCIDAGDFPFRTAFHFCYFLHFDDDMTQNTNKCGAYRRHVRARNAYGHAPYGVWIPN